MLVLPGRHFHPGAGMSTRNSRIGLVLFTIYLALYGGFVLLNAFRPGAMEVTPWAGINLAVLYGLGLIIAAVVLALIYGIFSREGEDQP
jgi:uncharacterized membrane protein (DUF485 family)